MERLTIFACPGATFVENVVVAGLLGMLSYVAQYSYARSGPGIDYCISPDAGHTEGKQNTAGSMHGTIDYFRFTIEDCVSTQRTP